MSYKKFIASKTRKMQPVGFEPTSINPMLFDWQSSIVRWAVRRGRAAIFADCGLGKTPMQLAWAASICKQTGGRVIVHCPVGVRQQTKREAEKFNIDVPVNVVDEQSQVTDGISLVNYEKLHRLDASAFVGVVLDESSILKSLDGKTRRQLTEAYKDTQYRLACSATPAPNDYMEIGNQCEWLGVMRREEMLATFFVHDGGETSKWRLKGHATADFWEWLSSWCVFMRRPSDIGFSDDGYQLPKLQYIDHVLDHGRPQQGMLFSMPASTLADRRNARKETASERIRFVADLVNQSDEPWVCWVNLNNEGEELTAAIDGAVEIAGRHTDTYKEDQLSAFADGRVRVLVTKPRICGFGMNWQHVCRTAIYPTDSWEQWYQMVRRFWRYGQTRDVEVHCVLSELETTVLDNIRSKEREADEMIAGVVSAMRESSIHELRRDRSQDAYKPTQRVKVPSWLQNASTVDAAKTGYSIAATAAT